MQRKHPEDPQQPIQSNAIVSGGSADSVLTSAEVLRHLSGPTAIVVTRPKEIDTAPTASWPQGTTVTLVGLAVNKPRPDPTLRFLEALHARGHHLEAIVDEHSRVEWTKTLAAAGLSIEDLTVQPRSQEDRTFRSAGSVLRHALEDDLDRHGLALLQAAEDSDARGFQSNGLAYCANAVLKAAPRNHGRKVRLVRWLASSPLVIRLNEAVGSQETVGRFLQGATDREDAEVLRWAQEYAALEAEHDRLLREAIDEGDGVVSFSIVRPVDMTVLTKAFYDAGARVILFEHIFYPDRKQGLRCLGIGTDDRALRIGRALEAADVPHATSTRRKLRVGLEHASRALEVIKQHVREAGPPCRLPSVAVGVSPQRGPDAAGGDGSAPPAPLPHPAGSGGSSRGLTGSPSAERSVIPPRGGTEQARSAWHGGFRRAAGSGKDRISRDTTARRQRS